MSWEIKKLSECCVSIADGDHQAPPKADSGIPFVTISNINSTNQFDFSNTMFVPQAYYDDLDSKRKAQKGDVLYSVVGSFGIPVYMRETVPFVFQRHIAILRPNDAILPQFLYYTMLSRDFYMMADAAALGAAQRTVSLTALRNMKIAVPPMNVQQKIVDILSSYDDLIEINQKQIKLLEEAAQRLYKEWFVDLRFPSYETTPITDGIPEGWRKVEVGTCISKIARTKQVMTADMLETGAIPVVDQSRSFVAGYTNDTETIVDFGVPVIVFGDHTRVLKYIQFPFAKGADGTQLIVSNSEKMPQSLFYCSLVNVDLSNHHYARHFKYLKAEEILLPTYAVACEFDKVVAPLFKQAQKLRDKCTIAAEARDRLLPKLMNGEIEV